VELSRVRLTVEDTRRRRLCRRRLWPKFRR